jgi:hypothetical protein
MKKSREKMLKLILRREAIVHLTETQLTRVIAGDGSGDYSCRTGSGQPTLCTTH